MKESKGIGIKTMAFLMLVIFIMSFISGYYTRQNKIDKDKGIVFSCNPYTSKHLDREGCNATMTIQPSNVTIIINSNFDDLKVLTDTQ